MRKGFTRESCQIRDRLWLFKQRLLPITADNFRPLHDRAAHHASVTKNVCRICYPDTDNQCAGDGADLSYTD
jgi:hypothetical protein